MLMCIEFITKSNIRWKRLFSREKKKWKSLRIILSFISLNAIGNNVCLYKEILLITAFKNLDFSLLIIHLLLIIPQKKPKLIYWKTCLILLLIFFSLFCNSLLDKHITIITIVQSFLVDKDEKNCNFLVYGSLCLVFSWLLMQHAFLKLIFFHYMNVLCNYTRKH